MKYDFKDSVRFVRIDAYDGVGWIPSSRCTQCDPGINDLGQYQCIFCLRLLGVEYVKEILISENKIANADVWEIAWKQAFKDLERVKSLYRRGLHDRLQIKYVVYRDQDGTVVNKRHFYHELFK